MLLCEAAFDENLSRELVAWLSDCIPSLIAGAPGSRRGSLRARFSPAPALNGGMARSGTHPTRDAEFVLRRDAIRITDFAADPALGVLLLDRQSTKALGVPDAKMNR